MTRVVTYARQANAFFSAVDLFARRVRACEVRACASARCVGPSRVRPPPDLLHISARYMSMCIRVTLISLSEHRTKHTTQVTLRRPRRAHTACELRDTRGRRGRGDARRTHSARTTQRLNPRLGVRWTAAKLTFEHASFWPAQRKKNEFSYRFESFSIGKPACQTEYRTSL